MNTPEFVGVGVDFVNSLLFMRPLDSPYEQGASDKNHIGANALNNLIVTLFRDNKSWDYLFTANQFKGYHLDYGYSEVGYYVNHLSDKQKPIKNRTFFNVDIKDPNLAAGFITTARFNNRYFNTINNEGRKRAAAVIRIGLCDNMFPVIERNEKLKNIESKIAKGIHYQQTLEAVSPDRHGAQKDCMQCHIYRGLDHLAWSLRATELVLSKKPALGRLTYILDDGSLIDKKIKGIGAFTKELIQLEQYKKCQVRNIWSQYVGSKDALDFNPLLLQELVTKYSQLEGRIKPFISHLLTLQIFRQGSQEPLSHHKILYKRAAKVLKRCTHCHRGMLPDFSVVPIMWKGKNQTAFYLNKVYYSLGLSSNSHKRYMPPAKSTWQPSEEEIRAVKEWIDGDAPDMNDVLHLNRR